ncbi:MAG: flippase-like domain-containing protein [Chloroflexi bacterium]|nr:flippase-like domain-containing protein [Chloroflexota bacterium]MCI0841214.1 flippase-like domain-containing protein [Chloroflexota bacterium]
MGWSSFSLRRPPTYVTVAAYGAVATGIGIALGWLVLKNIAWDKLGASLSSANFTLVLAALALYVLAGYLRGLRWRLVLGNDKVSAGRLFLIEQTGTAMDTFSPIRVLDELVEIGILVLRDKLKLGTILATLALQRTFEFGTTVLIMGIGVLLLEPLRPYWPYFTVGITLGSVSLILLFTVGPALSRIPALSKLAVVPQFASAVVLLRQDVGRSALAFLISLAQALLIGMAGWLVAQAVHIDLGLHVMIVITLGVMFFSSAVPGLPLALGTFEFGVVNLLGLWGIDPEQAIAFSLVLHAVLFLPPIFFAMLFLPREGLLSLAEIKALASRTRVELSSAGTSRYLD